MRHLPLLAVLLAIAGCSPTTDISRTSTELAAGRQPYTVVDRQASGDSLRIRMKVWSWASAHTVAEDVAVRARAPFQRVEVDVFGPAETPNGSPGAVLTWSTAGGFAWTREPENR